MIYLFKTEDKEGRSLQYPIEADSINDVLKKGGVGVTASKLSVVLVSENETMKEFQDRLEKENICPSTKVILEWTPLRCK